MLKNKKTRPEIKMCWNEKIHAAAAYIFQYHSSFHHFIIFIYFARKMTFKNKQVQ